MTVQEFSNEFDVLYNNIMSNQAPGLDEYEKSVFLTKAQNEVIKNYFNPKGNKYQEGFDGNAKRQIDFSSLIRVVEPLATQSNIKFDERSQVFRMPTDVLFILNETAMVTSDGIERLINIIPISFEEYSRLVSKPYKLPLKNQGWRLFQYTDSKVTFISEVVANGTIENYKIRYVKRPKPIILTDLTDSGISIDGLTDITYCELDPILHPEILQRAVELAKAAYTGDIKSIVELGQRSE